MAWFRAESWDCMMVGYGWCSCKPTFLEFPAIFCNCLPYAEILLSPFRGEEDSGGAAAYNCALIWQHMQEGCAIEEALQWNSVSTYYRRLKSSYLCAVSAANGILRSTESLQQYEADHAGLQSMLVHWALLQRPC
jgi:hypothetical protein